MNITLRKASAIQNTILDAIKAIKVTHTVELNEFQNPETEIKRANDELVKNDQRRASLLTAYYNIRGLVAQANSSAGIDLLLTKAAFIDKRVGQVEELAGATAMTDLAVITGKIEKLKARPADARASIYGYNDTVSTSVLAQAQVDQAKKQISDLKKQKQKINDEVLELNIKTEIPLSDEIANVLAQEGLV
jgi:hypothetical protein